jgi:hypothetical protein
VGLLAFTYDEATETCRNPRSDDNLDDNCDDTCSPSDDAYTTICGPSFLVTASARSWQSRGQGRVVAVATVSWWAGYRPAGGYRLSTANNRESTGIVRFLSEVGDSQSGCCAMGNGH